MSEHWDALAAIADADGELFDRIHEARLELDAAKGPDVWPARFRAAAEVARGFGRGDLPRALERMADFGSPDEVEAIGRALLGESS